jgi:PAS domain-containing protein
MLTGTLPFEGNIVEILTAHMELPVPPMTARRGAPIDSALEALVMRAMEKQPTHRHSSAAAFRYELNTVMDMLDMSTRRRTSQNLKPAQVREALQISLFQASPVAQALLDAAGAIVVSNQALAMLVARDTLEGVSLAELSLCEAMPQLPSHVEATAADQQERELAVRVTRDDGAEIDLAVWLLPLKLGTGQVHMLVRVKTVAPTLSS